MTEWPTGLGALLGGALGLAARVLLSRAAKRLGRGEFQPLAAVEGLGAFLFGLAAGWLLAHPEAAPLPAEFLHWAFVGFIALGPNLRDPAEPSPFFRMVLGIGGAVFGLLIGLRP